MRILVTRPKFDAERTSERLIALGHKPLIDPMLEIEALPLEFSSDVVSGIAFTSANAVRAVSANAALKKIPTFAVGSRTAEVARECGFENVGVAAGDVNALAGLLAAELPKGAHVIHLAGEDQAGNLPGDLTKHGIMVETKVVYRARASGQLKPETIAALREGRIDVILHYSERSAATFLRLAHTEGIADDIRKTRHLCLSSAIAGPLKLFGIHSEIAAAPEETALFDLIGP